jgi:FAD/FMN-containing dehydrogenase
MSAQGDTAGFTNALAGFIKPENMINDTALLEQYSRDNCSVTGSRPLLAVYPETKDDLKRLVKLANEYKMPLIPVSSGPPHFHGGTVPEESGIVVNFQKMDRILKIDKINRCVMLEPGVTFKKLIPELKQHGLRLNMPLAPRATKSVLTAYLEREPLLIPKYQYDNIDPLLTVEVIFGTGDEFRTGSASGPGDMEHLNSDKVNPWGPGSLDYVRFISSAQGTMGLVTWANIKVEVLPSIQELYYIAAAKVTDLLPLLAGLLRKRVLDECLVLNNASLAALLAEDTTELSELKSRLPPWTALVGIAGYQRRPEERVHIQRRHLMNICGEHQLMATAGLIEAGGRAAKLPDLLSNVWTKEPYWKLVSNSSRDVIFFLSPVSRVAEYVELMQRLYTTHGCSFAETGCYLQPVVQGRGCHCEFNLPGVLPGIDARTFWSTASEILMQQGAFFSRPYGDWADMVYRRDSESTAALRKLKNVFDPYNILNPGKLCF